MNGIVLHDNMTFFQERKTNRYFINKMTSTGRAAHIGAFHKYRYRRSEIRMSHAEVIRSLRRSPPVACSPSPPCILSFLPFTSRASDFIFSLSAPFYLAARLFSYSSLPPVHVSFPHTVLRYSPVLLFFALWRSFVPTADVQPFVGHDRTKKGA